MSCRWQYRFKYIMNSKEILPAVSHSILGQESWFWSYNLSTGDCCRFLNILKCCFITQLSFTMCMWPCQSAVFDGEYLLMLYIFIYIPFLYLLFLILIIFICFLLKTDVSSHLKAAAGITAMTAVLYMFTPYLRLDLFQWLS